MTKEKTVKVKGTFNMVVVIREDANLEKLLREETEFLGDPKSEVGFVDSMELESFKVIEDK